MTDRELLQEALEVMEDLGIKEAEIVSEAIRTRLAQPSGNEPVIDKTMATRIATQLGWQPKKEWVGLTNDEQLEAIWESGKDGLTGDRYDVALAIEAKLKEKNGN